jgi:pre-rRNA-processing protein TSR3
VALDILILRDPRESAKKCSLTPLHGMSGVEFVVYRADRRIAAGSRILLHPNGEPLSRADHGRGLLLVDCAWRKVDLLLATIDGDPPRRRLPPLVSAYPRKSKLFQDPTQGLASIEALYAALALLGEPAPELLAQYRWADEFLRQNPMLAR